MGDAAGCPATAAASMLGLRRPGGVQPDRLPARTVIWLKAEADGSML